MAISLRDQLLAKAKKSAAENNAQFRKKPLWPFKPQDGDSYLVRPLTDGNHLVNIAAHGETKDLAGGKKKQLEYLCFEQFGLPCPMCEENRPRRDFLAVFLFCRSYKDAKGKEIPLCDEDGRTSSITLPDGKKIPANPLRIFLRSPGKGYANHFSLLEMDKEYEKKGGLAGRDFRITRNGAGMDTSYAFIPKDPEPFVKPAGMEEKHAETLEKVMTALQENDMAAIVDFVLPLFELPEGITEYPKGSDYIFPEAEEGFTEDGAGSEDEGEEPPFTPDKKGKGITSRTEPEAPAPSARRQRRRAAPADAASKQSGAAADDEFGDDDE